MLAANLDFDESDNTLKPFLNEQFCENILNNGNKATFMNLKHMQ